MRNKKIITSENMSLKNFILFIEITTISLFLFGFILYRANADFVLDKNSGVSTATESFSSSMRDNPNIEMIDGVSRPIIQPTSQLAMPTSEVHIANNGLMLLRGSRIISISNNSTFENTIRVLISWDSIDAIWEVRTNLSTEILTSDGNGGTISDLHVGDAVTVIGNLVKGGEEPIINARFIRE